MIDSRLNLKIVRASAGYDLVATAGFMTPWTATLLLGGLTGLSAQLGLERAIPVIDSTAMLFANLLGSIVVVWSVWRLRHASQRVGRYDACARGLFALWQLYAVSQGASVLILAFTVMELVFAVAQSLPVHAPNRHLTPTPTRTNVHPHRQHQNAAFDDHLPVAVDIEHRHAVVEAGDDQGAEEGAVHCA